MEQRSAVRTLTVDMIGGSTVVLELGGLRLITDPTLDPPADAVDGRPHRTTPPAVGAAELGRVDVALVSHDQHPDNLDAAGRTLLAEIPLVLTTTDGAERLGGSAHGLAPFEHVDVGRPDGGAIRITALPAEHGPRGAEVVSGPVVGFLLSGADLPTVYVSGDNASLDVVRDIASRVGAIDVALLFAGGASVPDLFGGAPLTLTSADAVHAARALGARAVVPAHYDGWTHYTQGTASLVEAFDAADMGHVLRLVATGEAVEL
jgi:L-ascorbate metabolism protein UlaG (beta-lactamase superfamily)